jgi:hypothetical protein
MDELVSSIEAKLVHWPAVNKAIIKRFVAFGARGKNKGQTNT